jgi:hypothetical protein
MIGAFQPGENAASMCRRGPRFPPSVLFECDSNRARVQMTGVQAINSEDAIVLGELFDRY